jgi:hypothetical protein
VKYAIHISHGLLKGVPIARFCRYNLHRSAFQEGDVAGRPYQNPNLNPLLQKMENEMAAKHATGSSHKISGQKISSRQKASKLGLKIKTEPGVRQALEIFSQLTT